TYAFESAGRIVCAPKAGGMRHLGVLDEETRRLEILEPPYSEVSSPQAGPGFVVMVAGSSTEAPAIVRVDLGTRRRDVLRRSSQVSIDPGYLSIPQAIEFPTEDGNTAHGFFYPPRNRDFAAPSSMGPGW